MSTMAPWTVGGSRGCRRAGRRRARRWSGGRASRRRRRRTFSDGLGVGTRGIEGRRRNQSWRGVGRGVLVGEGVDGAEGGPCGGGVAPALGLCFAPGPGFRSSPGWPSQGEEGRGRSRGLCPLLEAPPRACRQPGRVEQRPPSSRHRCFHCSAAERMAAACCLLMACREKRETIDCRGHPARKRRMRPSVLSLDRRVVARRRAQRHRVRDRLAAFGCRRTPRPAHPKMSSTGKSSSATALAMMRSPHRSTRSRAYPSGPGPVQTETVRAATFTSHVSGMPALP